MVQQKLDIILAFSQRRNMNMVAAEPIIEVFAHRPLCFAELKILMGSNHNSGINPFWQITANRKILPFLEQAQQFYLR